MHRHKAVNGEIRDTMIGGNRLTAIGCILLTCKRFVSDAYVKARTGQGSKDYSIDVRTDLASQQSLGITAAV
jgi:hypothetical protein